MVFAVNTVVLQCRCEGGHLVARVLVCVCVRFNALPITLGFIFKNFICIASFIEEMLFKAEHSLYYILHSTGQHIQWLVVVQ